MNNPTPPYRRFVTAYWLTARVLLSYGGVWLLRGWISQRTQDRWLHSKHKKNAKRLRIGIENLQGLYIKVGQLFSILANFLPAAFRSELEGLQDAIPPREFSAIEERVREEFGESPSTLFQTFDPHPIASASLGQVHRATLPTGEDVAVKVRYPGIETIVQSDLITLRRIVGLLERLFPGHGLTTVYEEVEQMVRSELDFEQEAASLLRISANFSERDMIEFPVLYEQFCTGRILTTGYIEGEKITAALRHPMDVRRDVAERLVDAYCKQIFEDGVYHADPHPGNIRLTPDGDVVLLDFGATAELSLKMREGIVALLQAVLSKNTEKIQRALGEMGFLNRRASPEVIEQIIGVLHERLQTYFHVETLNLQELQVDPQILFDTLTELRRMNVGVFEVGDFFHIPKEWILLERTLLLLTGLCTELDPSIQPMELLKPYLEKMLARDQDDWTQFALETAQEVGLQALTLPADLKKFIRRANLGRLEVRTPAVEVAAERIYSAARQLMWTGFAIASGVLSSLFYLNQEPDIAMWLAYAAGSFGGLLMLSILRDMVRPKGR